MSSEHKISDGKGKYTIVMKNGQRVSDANWRKARIILSNQRLIIVTQNDKKPFRLKELQLQGSRQDINQMIAEVSDYICFKNVNDEGEENIWLITTEETEELLYEMYDVILDNETILTRSPTIEGGVVRETIDWEQGQLIINEDGLEIAKADGGLVEIRHDEVSEVETSKREIRGSIRPYISVNHVGSDGETQVQTDITGSQIKCIWLEQFLKEGLEEHDDNVELSEIEEDVIVALYSGVEPWDIPNFIDIEVDKVEEIYKRLVDAGVMDEVRLRREVKLTSRGRKLASKKMNT